MEALTESFIFYPAERFDIVAEKQGVYQYFQVTADMTAQETFEREIRPLENIRDNYEKMILTMDRLTPGNYNGIQVRYLLDWLIETKDCIKPNV